jgi:type I restriction-modification system DNA methylase subunit
MRPEDLGRYYESILDKEVRKESGVYYTPEYIVDYIVANTIGKMLEKKTPAEAAKIKIVDPACGAGVFLIGAYQYLLDWHERHFGNLTLTK